MNHGNDVKTNANCKKKFHQPINDSCTMVIRIDIGLQMGPILTAQILIHSSVLHHRNDW